MDPGIRFGKAQALVKFLVLVLLPEDVQHLSREIGLRPAHQPGAQTLPAHALPHGQGGQNSPPLGDGGHHRAGPQALGAPLGEGQGLVVAQLVGEVQVEGLELPYHARLIQQGVDFPDVHRMEKIRITDVKRRRDNEAVKISESMENLFEKITNQNFVPVVDDNGIFIGIVTRKDILLYLAGKIQRMEADAPKN